eukprot:9480320-Prorocentrum_lima.AAC.1
MRDAQRGPVACRSHATVWSSCSNDLTTRGGRKDRDRRAACDSPSNATPWCPASNLSAEPCRPNSSDGAS